MTSREKALELLKKFKDENYFSQEDIKENSKWNSLIAVNEVIEQWEYINTYLADGNGDLNPNLKYWLEVRDYLNTL